MNQFLSPPSSDFAAVRDGRKSMPFWLDVDLSSARSIAAGTALVINIAGNSFYIDADTENVGDARVHFQDATLNNASAPIYVSAGSIMTVPFTQIMIENDAQAAKRLRILYGVDIDFRAGVNTSIKAINQSQVRKPFSHLAGTVGLASVSILPANPNRDYLLIQNPHPTANLYIKLDGTVASIITSIRVPPGGSLELSNTVTTSAIYAISDTAGTNIVMVEA